MWHPSTWNVHGGKFYHNQSSTQKRVEHFLPFARTHLGPMPTMQCEEESYISWNVSTFSVQDEQIKSCSNRTSIAEIDSPIVKVQSMGKYWMLVLNIWMFSLSYEYLNRLDTARWYHTVIDAFWSASSKFSTFVQIWASSSLVVTTSREGYLELLLPCGVEPAEYQNLWANHQALERPWPFVTKNIIPQIPTRHKSGGADPKRSWGTLDPFIVVHAVVMSDKYDDMLSSQSGQGSIYAAWRSPVWSQSRLTRRLTTLEFPILYLALVWRHPSCRVCVPFTKFKCRRHENHTALLVFDTLGSWIKWASPPFKMALRTKERLMKACTLEMCLSNNVVENAAHGFLTRDTRSKSSWSVPQAYLGMTLLISRIDLDSVRMSSGKSSIFHIGIASP